MRVRVRSETWLGISGGIEDFADVFFTFTNIHVEELWTFHTIE